GTCRISRSCDASVVACAQAPQPEIADEWLLQTQNPSSVAIGQVCRQTSGIGAVSARFSAQQFLAPECAHQEGKCVRSGPGILGPCLRNPFWRFAAEGDAFRGNQY